MAPAGSRRRVVIMGAGGRDFHNFNVAYRDDDEVDIVAFTAAQIPGIADRTYPPSLAGPNYSDGIPIVDESSLESLLAEEAVDEVVFAYSDVTHEHVMHQASRVQAAGASFTLLGPGQTMLTSRLPVIAVCAVRTGCGKSQTTRHICELLTRRSLRPGVIRHPMPYGDLQRQAVQRFANAADLLEADCTIEEREEYEPYVDIGAVVFAGVDYARVLEKAEAESDIILWDGGNNDFPFIKPSLMIALTDALRPGHETLYHPGETVLRMADIAIIAKTERAGPAQVGQVQESIRRINPRATILKAASPVKLDSTVDLKGKRVLVVEDGPTLTHGGMSYGAGTVAAEAEGAEIVDPRPYAPPEIEKVYRDYPHLGNVLPAVGYYAAQIDALAVTINSADVDAVVSGTPIDLAAIVSTDKPIFRARYDYADAGEANLADEIDSFLARADLKHR